MHQSYKNKVVYEFDELNDIKGNSDNYSIHLINLITSNVFFKFKNTLSLLYNFCTIGNSMAACIQIKTNNNSNEKELSIMV